MTCPGAPARAELRPENTAANRTYLAPDPAARAQTWPETYNQQYWPRVTGDCQGTTEQILESAAVKWGFDSLCSDCRNLFKAQAVAESNWRQSKLGDFNQKTGQYDSFGILQVRRPWWPMAYESRLSTSLNADIAASIMRAYFDGATHLTSTRGSLWNAVGAWFCGCENGGGSAYVSEVKRHLTEKPWLKPGF